MKRIIKIKTKSKKYSIKIENNGVVNFFNSSIIKKSKIFIIVDKKLSSIINKKIRRRANVKIIEIHSSEQIKSFNDYIKLNIKLLQLNIDRSSTIIAIGGGTIGDLCGFVASTILRGVKFILVPTTLLSQVDSSIGGKNGINTKFGKNLIGTFYQPDLVIIDPSMLKSLSKKQIKSGYAEIVKHALINDKKFFFWLQKNFNKLLSLNNNIVIDAIAKSINIKAKYVNKDEKEKLINSHSRAMLNFGHTFGHALETMNNYGKTLTHGEAISIGMIIASKISYKLNYLTKSQYEKILNHFRIVGLPTFDKKQNKKRLYEIIAADKKNNQGKINLILLKNIGKSYYKRGLNIHQIEKLIK